MRLNEDLFEDYDLSNTALVEDNNDAPPSLSIKGRTGFDIMKMNKADYDWYSKKVANMSGFEKAVGEQVILPWIKGKNWMGGMNDTQRQKIYDKLIKSGIASSYKQIMDEEERQMTPWFPVSSHSSSSPDAVANEDEFDSFEGEIEESLKEDFEDIVEVDVPVVVNQPEELDKNDLLPEGPDTPEDRGLSDLILSLINDENDAIKQYSIAIANLGTHGEFKKVLDDIATEEYNHVGMLQTLLQKLSPNSETIKEGEVEAEEILNGDSLDYTIVEDETTDLEDYEDPDFYSLFGA